MTSPAPVITATGITAGSFSDWLAYFTAQYQAIFGDDVVLDNSSMDGQFLAIISQACADCCAGAIAVYNSFSPATAVGVGLSSNVKINGMTRLVPSFSVVNLTLIGIAGTVISNGQAVDINGNIWALPSSVTIPLAGSIVVTATCVTAGTINAAANTITGIQTGVYGWQSVTNVAAAIPGEPVETDAALRLRQSQSTSLPALTIFEGIVASIENLPGVTRARGYENNTSTVNADGIPANTLAFIVEGGVAASIQQAIFEKITPGIPTLGAISTVITDSNGSTRVINYAIPVPATISVAITLTPLTGWSADIVPFIQSAIAAYINELKIGDNVSFTGMIIPAYLLGTSYAGTYNITALTIQKNAGAPAAADAVLAYNEAPVSSVSDIAVTVS
jgi:uncharacterized phage protein gp47/JayE